MKKLLLFLIPAFVACSNSGNPQAPGTFELVTTRNGPGPGGPVSLRILVMDQAGNTISKLQTDASGHGSFSLAPGNYVWGAADSTWSIMRNSDSVTVIEGGKLQRVPILEWPLTITSGNTSRDTLVFCPLCV